jgi:predicted RNase H-like HicB family nuclease
MRFSAVVTKENRIYVANCSELDIASQGSTIEEALANLGEAIELYLEDPDAKRPVNNVPLVTFIEVPEVGSASDLRE